MGIGLSDYDKGAMGMGDEGCQKTVYIDNSSALDKELSVLKGEYNKLKRELAETKDTLTHRTWELQEANKKLPRLRYVDKDGMPTKEDGWCICVFKRNDGSIYTMMEDIIILKPHLSIDRSLIAWLPESEFLNAFMGDL